MDLPPNPGCSHHYWGKLAKVAITALLEPTVVRCAYNPSTWRLRQTDHIQDWHGKHSKFKTWFAPWVLEQAGLLNKTLSQKTYRNKKDVLYDSLKSYGCHYSPVSFGKDMVHSCNPWVMNGSWNISKPGPALRATWPHSLGDQDTGVKMKQSLE